jgi:hypothetical protein
MIFALAGTNGAQAQANCFVYSTPPPSTLVVNYTGAAVSIPITINTRLSSNCPSHNGYHVTGIRSEDSNINKIGTASNAATFSIVYASSSGAAVYNSEQNWVLSSSIGHSWDSLNNPYQYENNPYQYEYIWGDPNKVSTATFLLQIPASQATTSGTKRIVFKLAQWESSNVTDYVMTIDFRTQPTTELVISGLNTGTGVTTGSLDFGAFNGSASTRGLSIRAHSTSPYAISFESSQSGVMRRTTATSCETPLAAPLDAAEQIPYVIDAGGRTITPAARDGVIGAANQYSSTTNTNASPNERVVIPVSITVPAFNLGDKRAGRFCDVLRVRIEAVN